MSSSACCWPPHPAVGGGGGDGDVLRGEEDDDGGGGGGGRQGGGDDETRRCDDADGADTAGSSAAPMLGSSCRFPLRLRCPGTRRRAETRVDSVADLHADTGTHGSPVQHLAVTEPGAENTQWDKTAPVRGGSALDACRDCGLGCRGTCKTTAAARSLLVVCNDDVGRPLTATLLYARQAPSANGHPAALPGPALGFELSMASAALAGPLTSRADQRPRPSYSLRVDA
ncbi:unnamed protein product [Lampetra planeri]